MRDNVSLQVHRASESKHGWLHLIGLNLSHRICVAIWYIHGHHEGCQLRALGLRMYDMAIATWSLGGVGRTSNILNSRLLRCYTP